MPDMLIRGVKPETHAWLKAEAKRRGRSLSDQAKIVIIRVLVRDGDLDARLAEEELAKLGTTLEGD